MSARGWQRILLGNASDVEMDSAGRILVAPELRAAVVWPRGVLSGMLTHFEIWDPAKRAENEQSRHGCRHALMYPFQFLLLRPA
jgi:MraZ protein